MRSNVNRVALVGALCGAVLLAACASGSAVTTRAASMPTDAEIRDDAALLAMFDTRGRDTVLVDRMLNSTNPTSRARAALVVGQNAMRERYPAIRRMLLDADTAVAANAAFALGLAKDTASLIALGRAFAGAADPVAREAAWAFGEIGDAARTVITIALGEATAQPRVTSNAAQRSPLVRAELLLAANKMRVVPAAAVVVWTADTADVVARAAVYTLSRQRIPAAVRPLLALAGHRDEGVRQGVARALARETAGDSLGARARDALATLLADASPRVRANAVRSLASYGTSARADVRRGLADADANVRVAATEALATVFAGDDAEWTRAWNADTTHAVRRAVLLAARRAGSAALASNEDTWFKVADWRFREAAIVARTLAPGDGRLTFARAGLTDGDGRVRAAAIAALPAADTATRVTAFAMLDDSDIGVRASALGIIGRAARAADVARVIDVYRAASNDRSGDARNASLRVIASAWVRDSSAFSSGALAALQRLQPPADAAARTLINAVTPLRAWRNAPIAPPRALSDYERLVRRWMIPGARMPVAVLRTERGNVTIELNAADAPLVVEAFVNLARAGYYRGSRFHRVVPNFVAQDGDPRGTGNGGPGFTLRDAYTRQRHDRGCLGLATSGFDTGGSQYYLCHWAAPHLDGHYTVFGHVRQGLDVMDAIVQGDQLFNVDIR